MAAINPVTTNVNSIRTAETNPVEKKTGTVGNFSKMLGDYVDNVNGQQQQSASAVQDLISGKSKDILPVVTAVAEADMSFKLLMGVRNKVIEAYRETMRMQI